MRNLLESLLYHLLCLAWKAAEGLRIRRGPRRVEVEEFHSLDPFRKEF